MISWIKSLFITDDNDFLEHSIVDYQRQRFLYRLRIYRILSFGTGVIFTIIWMLVSDLRESNYFLFLTLFAYIISWNIDARIKMIQLYEKWQKKEKP
jgi:hypothetical protein